MENAISNPDVTLDNQIEKTSYSPSSYRAVRKLRIRAAEYGIEVPYLQYPLTAKKTGGMGLKIMTILTGVLIAAAVGFLIWLLAAVLGPWAMAVGKTGVDVTEATKNIPIIDMFGAIGSLMIWLFVAGYILLPTLIGIGAVVYLINLMRVVKLSTEEKAVGYFLGRMKTSALAFGIGLTVAGVAGMIFFWPVGVVMLVGAVYAWALFAVLQSERNLAKVIFKQLPEANQVDFIAHSKALKIAASDYRIRRYGNRTDYSSWGKFAWLMRLLEGFIDAGIIYGNMKKSPLRKESKGLLLRAWRDLGLLFISAGVALWLVLAVGSSWNFWRIILMIVSGIWLLGELLLGVPQILNCAIKQIKLNRHPLAWVALVVVLLMVAGVIGGLIYAVNL